MITADGERESLAGVFATGEDPIFGRREGKIIGTVRMDERWGTSGLFDLVEVIFERFSKLHGHAWLLD